ncbi:MAG: chemotaxis protein CheW [Desulfuromonas sp.]|nr:chemotaxis protein CheW [Desulfuromonas sp.]
MERNMDEVSVVDMDRERQILRQRAVALAQETKLAVEQEDLLEIVEFTLADEHYAIEADCIAEVYPLKDFTPLPCTPVFVFGVVNLRGKIISVIDLRKFFDLPNKGLSDLNKIIVLRSDSMEFAILADTVVAARQLPLSQLLPSLPTLTDIRNEYLKGVTQESLVLLDGGKILADKKLLVHEEV